MKTEISKKLRAARALISDPTRWTRGTFARDSSSRPCSSSAEHAQRFCASGAMYRVSNPYVDGLRKSLCSATDILGGVAVAEPPAWPDKLREVAFEFELSSSVLDKEVGT